MRDDHISKHFGEQVIEVGARTDACNEGLVPVFRGFQIETVVGGVIEEIALDAPGLTVHLLPLRGG